MGELPNRSTSNTPAQHVADHNDMHALHNAMGGGQTFTVVTMTNPITGSGNITVLVYPANTSWLALKVSGDTYPRVVMGVTGDGWYFGDGTIDPTTGPNLNWDNTGLGIYGGDLTMAVGEGVVLTAPNLTRYRLKVSNAGALSTEVVV